MVHLLRRRQATEHLRWKYGYLSGPQALAKLATLGGGPPMRYRNGIPYYPADELDRWYESQFGPLVSSTSELPRGARRRGRPRKGSR